MNFGFRGKLEGLDPKELLCQKMFEAYNNEA